MTKITVNHNRGELTDVANGANNYFVFKIELSHQERLVFGEVFYPFGAIPHWVQINQNKIDKEKVKELFYAGSDMHHTGHRVEIKDSIWKDNPNFAIAIRHYGNSGRCKMIEVVLDKNRLDNEAPNPI